MRRLVVLGAGTAGTMIANKLRHRLDRRTGTITVVDRDDEHHYQPGYLFVPSARTTASRSSGRGTPSWPTASTSSSARSTASSPVERSGSSRAAGCLPTTSSSSPPARRRGPTRRPGCSGPSGGAASSTSTPSRARGARGARSSASTAGAWSCTSPRCRSSARWPRWSSPSWPTPGCATAGCATGSS